MSEHKPSSVVVGDAEQGRAKLTLGRTALLVERRPPSRHPWGGASSGAGTEQARCSRRAAPLRASAGAVG
jgi:hypothetical protein